MLIFSDMVQETIEVFMDDFSVVADSFDWFLKHLTEVLKICEDLNLVLNGENAILWLKNVYC